MSNNKRVFTISIFSSIIPAATIYAAIIFITTVILGIFGQDYSAVETHPFYIMKQMWINAKMYMIVSFAICYIFVVICKSGYKMEN